MSKKTKKEPMEELIETPMEELIEETKEDPKNDILREFVTTIKGITKTTITFETAQKIWDLWKQYTGRVEKYRACSACLIGKIKFMKKMCKQNGITL